jgi:class 3 adenylate cyclase
MPETRSPQAAASPGRASAPPGTLNDQTVECAVLFVDVVRYSEQPLAAQREIKQRLNAAVRQATVRLTPGERVLLDTGDGVAIAFLGYPEDALFVTLALLRALGASAGGRAVQLRSGINFGKVSVLRDVNGQPSVVGDGINMAQRVMSFANPGQLLVSRAFYQVLVAVSEDYADLFCYCGARTDKHVREHEVYELAAPLDRIEIALPPYMLPAHAAVPRDEDDPPARRVPPAPPSRRRQPGWVATAALLAILGIATHELAQRPAKAPAPQATPAPAAPVATAPAPAARHDRPVLPARAAPVSAAPRTAPRPLAAPPADARESAAAGGPDTAPDSATPAFVIAPWGEVRVDGRSYGASPPLTHLPLPAGEHQIEIDNGVSDPYRSLVRLEPGQALRIQHRFEDPPGEP